MRGPRHKRHAAPRTGSREPLPGGGPVTAAVVVAGLDGSKTSWDAFWWACGEAQRLDGRPWPCSSAPAPMPAWP